MFNRNSTHLLLATMATAMCANSTYADQIFVIDATNDMNSTERGTRTGSPYNDADGAQTFDLSTDGDSAAGLSGTLFVTSTGWFEEQHLAPVGVLGAPPVTGTKTARQHKVFHGDYAGDLNGGSSIATWTASGYTPGATVDVYLNYTNQGNYANEAPFTLTGTADGTIDATSAPTDDLVLNDTIKDHNFEMIGTATADSSGNVELTVSGADSWFPVSAAAFVLAGGIPGDFDGDGDVDGVDIAEMFSNFNGPGGGVPTNPDTDLDGDGDVDGVDIAALFGAFTGPLAPAKVPEPTSLALLGLGGLALARRRRA